MKIKRSIVLIVCCVVCISAIFIYRYKTYAQVGAPSEYEIVENERYPMEIISVLPGNIAFTIENKSNTMLYHLSYAEIEVDIDGVWHTLKPKAENIGSSVCSVPPNQITHELFAMANYYGTLKPGHYRMVKPLKYDGKTQWMAVKFEMTE